MAMAWCKRAVMEPLQTVLTRVNPFVAAYQSMGEVVREQEQAAAAEGREVPPVTMRFRQSHELGRRL